jgi:predicted acylesterase/phospholipase RssA
MPEQPRAKTALVISGGGSKGSFAVGALKYLVGELGLEFDVLAGTSTGALIAPMLAAQGSGALPTLEREYTTVTTGDILSGNLAWRVVTGEPSFHKSDPLRRRIEGTLTEAVYRQIVESGRQLAIATVNLKTGALVYYQTGTPIPSSDTVVPVSSREQLIRAMLASASVPVAMQPIEVAPGEGKPVEPFVDGGVREYAPIEVAIDAGAVDICCLVLAPEMKVRPEYTKRYGNVLDVLQRTIDLLSQEVGESDVKLSRLYTRAVVYLNAVRAGLLAAGVDPEVVARALDEGEVPSPFAGKVAVSLRIVRPQQMLRGDTLRFTPADMKWNLEYGYQCAREQWAGTRTLPVPSLFPTPAAAPAT